jgi:hypothetical protein
MLDIPDREGSIQELPIVFSCNGLAEKKSESDEKLEE